MGAIQKELKRIQNLINYDNKITGTNRENIGFALSSDVKLTWNLGVTEDYGTVSVISPSTEQSAIPGPIIVYMTEVLCDRHYEDNDVRYTPDQVKERLQIFHNITGIKEIFDVPDIANNIRLRDVECYDYIEVVIHMNYQKTCNISIDFNIYMEDGYSYDIEPDSILSITIGNDLYDKSLTVSNVFLDLNYLFEPINYDGTISVGGFCKPLQDMIKEYFQKLLNNE